MTTLALNAASEPLAQVAPLLFFAFAGLTVLSAWAIVLSQNIVRMSVYLLLTLGGAAGMYFMLYAEFLAAIQLIVYAGGTLILIVFGVMLTSKNPFMQLTSPLWERAVGVLLGGAIAGLLFFAMIHSDLPEGGGAGITSSRGIIELIGRSLLSTYLVPFEVAAVLLLLVMIGAAYLARRRAS